MPRNMDPHTGGVVSLAQAFSAIRSLSDLPTLAAQFGSQPAWEEFDPALLPLGSRLRMQLWESRSPGVSGGGRP